ncbi:MAG TPA: hypothetical protein VHE54_18260 [Puia sp.]|nr:hypothetical protein [Puia sp.]
MPTIEITLNVLVLGALLILSGIAGYLPRSYQLMRKDRQIAKLEGEMVQAHAELLDTQREFCDLEAKMKDITNPVITMNSKNTEDPPQTPLPERDGVRHHRATGSS